MENQLYPDYTSEIQNVKTKLTMIAEELREEPKAADIYEFRELMAIAEAFNKSDKRTVNPVSSYNTNSKIKELGETTIAKQPKTEDQVQPFIKKAEAAVAEASDRANVEQANSDLFNYYGWISDLKIASQTMVDITTKLNANPNLETAMKEPASKGEGTKQSESVLDGIKHYFEDLKARLEKVVDETGITVGQAGQALKAKLTEAGAWLQKNVVSKFVEAFKWLSEKFDAFRLKLFEGMFDFVRKVIDLATKKDWKIDHITVGMPEFGLSMTDLAGYKIPIPTIKGPPVSFTFKPK